MRAQADLSYPLLPDPNDLSSPARSLHAVDDFDWPESGPSQPRKAKVGPFGAKVVAAMTGAMSTSLLSACSFTRLSSYHAISAVLWWAELTSRSDSLRCAQDPSPDCPTFPSDTLHPAHRRLLPNLRPHAQTPFDFCLTATATHCLESPDVPHLCVFILRCHTYTSVSITPFLLFNSSFGLGDGFSTDWMSSSEQMGGHMGRSGNSRSSAVTRNGRGRPRWRGDVGPSR